jgi:ribose transport system ATP-binding protein/rhamnose transport system ATP-binding protein
VAVRLEMRGISKRFVGVQALSGVSLSADAGQILALVGENGAGKSTLIKILSGAQPPDTGEIRIDGEAAQIHSPAAAERYGIATVYQELNLFPYLSVAENLLFGRYPRRRGGLIDWRAGRRETERFLQAMGVDLPADRLVAELSIAERQMLEIAKALHRQVRILVLDEPTAVLGGRDVEQLLEMVRSLKGHGVATIFISHRLDEIFGLADRYTVLKDGELAGSGELRDTDEDALVSMMVGRELESLRPQESRVQGEEALRVEGISRAGVLDDVSFSLRKGEVLGVAGLRGAGRTELARAIFGADRIDAGRVYVGGREAAIGSPSAAIAHGIGLVPEDRKAQGLLMNLSTAENIPLVALASGATKSVRPSAERKLAAGYKQSLDIRVADVGAPVGTLSGGNQQKVVLAKWLEAGTSVLILDEPTRGIDIGSKREIYTLIRRLAADGVAVLLISSELPEVLEMSDRVLVMRQGRLAAEIDRADATEELIMTHAVGAGSDVVHGDAPSADHFAQAVEDAGASFHPQF